MNKDTAYWITLAHDLPGRSFLNKHGWTNEDKYDLIKAFYFDNKISISDFFELSEKEWQETYKLNSQQTNDLLQAKSKIPNNAFEAEQLQNNGIEIIERNSPEYPQYLKNNLRKSAPVILYVKGNKNILKERSIAIVGSRDASEIALKFTDNIAKLASNNFRVVVSGFAKGIDKQALDSAISYTCRSIIVLPQGISTFESGFRTYYRQIIDGDVLVLSTFRPKAGWSKEFAMARNPIIYGLAEEIYVAESKFSKNRQGVETKGGTWAGVIDGLKKGRKIFVRQSSPDENNVNNILIEKGAVAVDINGEIISLPPKHSSGLFD
ncbi:MAG: DNA-protecting protein DprA [Bacteroidales bacterium]|jgi:predicted Rossmann fold nucleotide-binding protein DprA/Smf involved in DNA uptake|nr:DNA-protecting protein DprA [Bacteroidales bacterium]